MKTPLTTMSLLLSLALSTTPASSEEHSQSSTAQKEATTSQAEDSVLFLPRPNQGLYWGLGLIYGVAGADDEDRGKRENTRGWGFNIRLGEAVADWFELGIDISLLATSGDQSMTLGHLNVQVQRELWPQSFIRAGLGFGGSGGADPEDPDFDRGRYGDVYTAALGYNIYLSDDSTSGGWLLTPVLTARIGPSEAFTATAVWFGLELSAWGGLSRDKLELGFEEAFTPEDD